MDDGPELDLLTRKMVGAATVVHRSQRVVHRLPYAASRAQNHRGQEVK
jgi:hypothetical protein